jgi:hypothetical protein
MVSVLMSGGLIRALAGYHIDGFKFDTLGGRKMAISKLGTYSLFLAVILWGTLLGGITYSHIVYFPVYLSALPDSAVVVNGPYGLHEARFWMTIHPLLILSLIAALVLNWKFRLRRKLILIRYATILPLLLALTKPFPKEPEQAATS